MVISIISTAFIRKYSINNNLYDIPNERSSHRVPKPKGGGIPIVGLLIFTIVTLFFYNMINAEITLSMLIGLILVAVAGLIDDYKNLSVSIRVIIYLISALLSLYFIGGLESAFIGEYSYYFGGAGYCIGVLFLVWLTNLYNFMDGIDGFAGVQTICVSIFCCFMFFMSSQYSLLIIMLCLASSTFGFLYWNWEPAKIFMGDVGSCSIGFFFGLLSIYTQNEEILSIGVWLILLAPFIGDATFTLLMRILSNEEWYRAHNSHAYQKLYRLGLSHHRLSLNLLLLNVLLIWPLAYIASTYKNIELFMIVLSYISTAIIWVIAQSKYRNSIQSSS